MLIDTHAHLYWDDYKQSLPSPNGNVKSDLDQVVQRAIEAGVTEAVIVGVDPQTSQIAATFQAPPLKTYSSVGIHPHDAHRYLNNPSELIAEDIQKLETIALEYPDKVKLIGECGLDFFFEGNHDFVPTGLTDDQFKNLQRQLFQAHIDLAKKLNLPLTIHCRDDRSKNPENIDCWLQCLEMLQGSHGILHCYSGYPEITKRAMEMDFLVSFAANITYPKNEYLREAVRMLPLEKIVLETDCPFLAPQSTRGQRNEPASIKEIAQLIAELKGVTLEEVANQTTLNFQKLI